MWRRFSVACVAIGLGSCGGGKGPAVSTPGADTFTEGSRLKARWLQAPDTPRFLVGWYDSQMNVNCQFRTAYYDISRIRPEGGDFYCLPVTTSATSGLFADPACTQPVSDVGCDSWLVEVTPPDHSDCDAVDRFFPAGASVIGAPIYTNEGGGCTAIAASDARVATAHKLGAEIPLTSFVHARVAPEAGSARVVRKILSADDGSSQVWGAWDTARSEGVFPPDWANRTATVGPGKWEPERLVPGAPATGLFADAACSQEVATFEACGTVAVKSVYQPPAAACTNAAAYFATGAELTAAQIHDTSSGSCAPSVLGGPPPEQRFISVGAAIPSDSFADVRSVEQGSGRVRSRVAGIDAGPIAGAYQYYFDTQSGANCVPWIAADGKMRCVPEFSTANVYADAACTIPVFVWSPGDGICPTDTPSMIGVDEILSSNACGEVFHRHVFPVGAVRTAAIYSGAPGAGCDLIPADARATWMVNDLGPESPASDFVALSRSNPF